MKREWDGHAFRVSKWAKRASFAKWLLFHPLPGGFGSGERTMAWAPAYDAAVCLHFHCALQSF